MNDNIRNHITWDNFLECYLAPEVPATYPIAGFPKVELFVSEQAERMGLRVFQVGPPDTMELPLSAVEFAVYKKGSEHVLEVSTQHEYLFRPFFGVLLELADAIQIDGYDVSAAVMDAMARLNALADRKTRMSDEKALGLMGELWVLTRLVEKSGHQVANAWLGFESESHDFRFNGLDVEVKTTAQPKRIHMIGSPHQLVPSGERSLFLVSIHLARTGVATGLTLPSMVDSLLARLPTGTPARELVDFALNKLKYRDTDRALYSTAYHLRSDPQAFKVDDEFPKITPESLRKGVGTDLIGRIERVSYSIDIDDLPPTLTAIELIQGEKDGEKSND
jgi:hypothetical protein